MPSGAFNLGSGTGYSNRQVIEAWRRVTGHAIPVVEEPIPFIGGVISGHRTAYKYLPRSVANFPAEPALAQHMRDAGFVDVRWESLSLGIAAIHVGRKA